VGTPYYVSPEVVKGAGYDWKSDVWSLGCLLYELALLRSPFEMEGASLMAVFKKISEADYQPLQVRSSPPWSHNHPAACTPPSIRRAPPLYQHHINADAACRLRASPKPGRGAQVSTAASRVA
jgi:serine/threonine protein kinase